MDESGGEEEMSEVTSQDYEKAQKVAARICLHSSNEDGKSPCTGCLYEISNALAAERDAEMERIVKIIKSKFDFPTDSTTGTTLNRIVQEIVDTIRARTP